MFVEWERKSAIRDYRVICASVAAHIVVLAGIVFYSPRPAQLEPNWLAWGDTAHSYHITYVPNGDEEVEADAAPVVPSKSSLTAPREHARTKKVKPVSDRQPEPDADEGNLNSKAGSPFGQFVDGPVAGHDVHIAFPVVYPDPPIDRSALPKDLVGDVIVEVTIDSEGNVVATKIIESIGHGIDEKIEATLRRWHYQPATLDGVPVASHHDAHFHFPA